METPKLRILPNITEHMFVHVMCVDVYSQSCYEFYDQREYYLFVT